MTEMNIDITHVSVETEVVSKSIEQVSIGDAGPVTVSVDSVGSPGIEGQQGPQGIQGVPGSTGAKGDPGGLVTATSFSGDLNTLTTPGTYEIFSGTNLPEPDFSGIVMVTKGLAYITQTMYGNGIMYTRTGLGFISGAWTKSAVVGQVGGGALTGIGFPNGVVSGTVGQRYVDTAATNGAVEWIKASGTGNTGWKVAYGDTGWRNVGSLLLDPSVWDLSVSWFRIRRTSASPDQAWLSARLRRLTTGGEFTLVDIPAGFRAVQTDCVVNHLGWRDAGPGNTWINAVSYNSKFRLQGMTSVAPPANQFYQTVGLAQPYLLHSSDLAWPATLPGTAA